MAEGIDYGFSESASLVSEVDFLSSNVSDSINFMWVYFQIFVNFYYNSNIWKYPAIVLFIQHFTFIQEALQPWYLPFWVQGIPTLI